jgi:transposase
MAKEAFLGCDVSKGYCDFLLLGADMQVLEPTFVLTDNKEGRLKLRELISNWYSSGITQLYCGVESTGGYENNWFYFLRNLSKELPVLTARLNPRGVKAVSDASLKRTITDAVSAENIAAYLIHFSHKVDYGNTAIDLNNKFSNGRQHLNYIKMLTKQKVQLSNQLEKLLYQHFSEMLVYCRNGIPGWLLRMLTKYSSGYTTHKAGIKKLVTIKGISGEKAQSIIIKTKSSDPRVSKHTEHLISRTASEILHKSGLIDSEKAYLGDLYKENEQVLLLTTIPGVGLNSAIAIMLEIEDINRFETAKKMASFFGVHPSFKQSGDGVWGNHMSKKGRSEIRAVLYMTALTGVRFNPILKAIYARFRAKGMKHYQAMGVIMHKLLRIIFGVLRTQKAFEVEIDLLNVNRSAQKQVERSTEDQVRKTENLKNRNRYKTELEDAPISRIKHQKQKKQLASQST